jgi:hypothetical protein
MVLEFLEIITWLACAGGGVVPSKISRQFFSPPQHLHADPAYGMSERQPSVRTHPTLLLVPMGGVNPLSGIDREGRRNSRHLHSPLKGISPT